MRGEPNLARSPQQQNMIFIARVGRSQLAATAAAHEAGRRVHSRKLPDQITASGTKIEGAHRTKIIYHDHLRQR